MMLMPPVPVSDLITRVSSHAMPMLTVSNESGTMTVQFPAYLAILLGTLIPVGFLVILYIQSETRNAAMASFNQEEDTEELEFE